MLQWGPTYEYLAHQLLLYTYHHDLALIFIQFQITFQFAAQNSVIWIQEVKQSPLYPLLRKLTPIIPAFTSFITASMYISKKPKGHDITLSITPIDLQRLTLTSF